jgi:hypothetical protein
MKDFIGQNIFELPFLEVDKNIEEIAWEIAAKSYIYYYCIDCLLVAWNVFASSLDFTLLCCHTN